MATVNYRPNRKGAAGLLNSPKTRRALNDAGNDLIDRARALAARERDSGDYLRGFRMEQTSVRVDSEPRAAVRVGNVVPYAAAVEWGNKRRPASRILRRAAESS